MEHYLGEKLKKLRESRGWTQADLAKRLNKAVSTASGYESDGLKARSLEVRTRIAIVRVPAQIGKAVLLCVGFKDTLLVGNGITFALQLVLMG